MKHRGQEGRDEQIIDPDIPIIDAHHHLRIQPTQHYLLEDYLADIQSGHKITATVYLESRVFMKPDGPEVLRPIGEIEYANGVGAMGASGFFGPERVCAAIIGYADFRLGDAVAQYFDRALEIASERFRGVRQVTIEHHSEAPYRFIPHRPPTGVMMSPGFDLAFRHLAPRGLTFDAAVFGQQLPEIIALADKYPDTRIILNHLGNPVLMELSKTEYPDVVRQWERDLRDLARRQNVFCKVGGLGLPFWGFGFDTREQPASYLELAAAWHPFVETAIEAFGPQRCMAESNFPPDGKSCGYVPYWNALKHLLRSYSSEEKAAFFYGTAARVYRIAMA
jgi:L-fuconolactonase